MAVVEGRVCERPRAERSGALFSAIESWVDKKGCWMNRLNREQEKTLRIIWKHRNENENRDLIERESGDRKLLLELSHAGFAAIHSSIRDDGDSDYQHVSLTSSGRCYFSEKRRDFVQRYMPVILSGGLGVIATLIGTFVGAFLTGWRP